jgi:TRAP transporter TAXI family solute receptor
MKYSKAMTAKVALDTVTKWRAMKGIRIPILIAFFCACVLFSTVSFSGEPGAEGGHAEEIFITIGSGDFSGVYFPAGLAMARIINEKRDVHGIRAAVEATSGAVFNLNAIAAGYMEFGLTQADREYQAVNGLAEWAENGPRKNLRSLFSLHHESLTLVAAEDADIESLLDLKNKVVSTGNPGSASQHLIVQDALEAVGLDPQRDISMENVMASNAPVLLEDYRLDAFFYIVGHPSEIIIRALSGERKTRIIPISGPPIDRLISANKTYSRSVIPMKSLYPGAGHRGDVITFGVVATMCTSSDVSADVVYTFVKELFENLDKLRNEHPALSHLTREGMLEGLNAPFHRGALEYYREAGLLE